MQDRLMHMVDILLSYKFSTNPTSKTARRQQNRPLVPKRFALLVVDTGNALIKPNFYDFGW